MDNGQVELYIDYGDVDKNIAYFDALLNNKEIIDSEFGGSLDWQSLDNKRASRIRYLITGYGLADQGAIQKHLGNPLREKRKV